VQDFEALTPNLLARTIETVEGGGLVILLLSNLSSLTQLYTLTMDVHSRLRTDAHQTVTGGATRLHHSVLPDVHDFTSKQGQI
jgi:N-acetyltransferase 10